LAPCEGSGGSELVLAPWEGSAIWRSAVARSVRGEAAPRRGKEETTPVGLTRILLGQKINKTHVVDSAVTNRR
jgi:hypothetical protein